MFCVSVDMIFGPQQERTAVCVPTTTALCENHQLQAELCVEGPQIFSARAVHAKDNIKVGIMDAASLFLQGAPLDVVFCELTTPFDKFAQEAFFNSAIAPFQEYLPPLRYLKTFIKRVMRMLEKEGLEVIDELVELAVETSLNDFSSTEDSEGEGHLIFRLKHSDTHHTVLKQPFKHLSSDTSQSGINLKRVDEVIIRRNTCHNQVGMTLWKAGLLLGDLGLHRSHLFRGRRVLELGSGTGITGLILAAVCHPSALVMTDFHDQVLQNLEFNASVNVDSSSECDVVVRHLDWSTCSRSAMRDLDADILIAADCTYSTDLCDSVLHTIQCFLLCDSAPPAPPLSPPPLVPSPSSPPSSPPSPSSSSSPSESAAVRALDEWQRTALAVDSATPLVLLRSRRLCLLCYTIRAPETLEFFQKALSALSDVAAEDVTDWVLQACPLASSSFHYQGGRDDLRVLCLVPACTSRPAGTAAPPH